MKKIICLILALVFTLGMVAAMAACKKCDHSDSDYNGKCDKCGENYGHVCADADKNHACDFCQRAMGEHSDADKDHACDYGCKETIGACEDADKDHACDHGCGATFGTCEDADKDHACDYGCDATFGTCEDADKDHACDYGCGATFGEHSDGDDDNHLCDYGCERIADDGCYDEVVDGKCDECGADIDHTCVDEDKNHACDICSKDMGEHSDANKDHVCDYGCSKAIGVCKDADKDHSCDYGCGKTYGQHTDGDDNNHDCDYGCGYIADDGCYDANDDSKCDECGGDYRDGFEPVEPSVLIDRVCTTVAQSSPTKIVTQIERMGAINIKGTFAVEKQGENIIYTYSYEKPGDPMVSDEPVVTVSGEIYYKDGRFSEDGGKTWTAGQPAIWSIYLNLNREYLINPKINSDGTVLSAEISPENAKATFGTDLNAEGNVTVTIKTDGQKVNYFDISCTTESGAVINVRTSYTYQSVELEFPSAE